MGFDLISSSIPPATHGTDNMLDDNIMASYEDHGGENFKGEDFFEDGKTKEKAGFRSGGGVGSLQGGRLEGSKETLLHQHRNRSVGDGYTGPEDGVGGEAGRGGITGAGANTQGGVGIGGGKVVSLPDNLCHTVLRPGSLEANNNNNNNNNIVLPDNQGDVEMEEQKVEVSFFFFLRLNHGTDYFHKIIFKEDGH